MTCSAIQSAMERFGECESTLDGSRIATHCLYPSFDSVYVYVAKLGNEYRVHDGGGAHKCAWVHGRDSHIISRAISIEAHRFHLSVVENSLASPDVPIEWLQSAILSVANASALAATSAVAKIVAAAEEALVDKIQRILSATFPAERIAREFSIRGRSGGERHFDFAVRNGSGFNLLINGISPHHSSISAKFVSFSDTDVEIQKKLAVHDRDLPADDTALLQQVAIVSPLSAFAAATEVFLSDVHRV